MGRIDREARNAMAVLLDRGHTKSDWLREWSRMRCRPSCRQVPSTAQIWPWARLRWTANTSSGCSKATPPLITRRMPSTIPGGRCVRLARVCLRMRLPLAPRLPQENRRPAAAVRDGLEMAKRGFALAWERYFPSYSTLATVVQLPRSVTSSKQPTRPRPQPTRTIDNRINALAG